MSASKNIVLMEGFDHSNSSATFLQKGWSQTLTGSNASALQTTGRFSGSTALDLASGSGVGTRQGITWTKLLPSTYTTLYCGFALLRNNQPTNQDDNFIFQAGATLACRLQITTAGKLTILNSGGTTIATGTTVVPASNTWHYIEIKLVVNGASGSVTVQLDGANEIPLTTGNFGSAAIDRISLCSFTTTTSSEVSNGFDDLYVEDNSGSSPGFLGQAMVSTLYPDADGSNLAWTPDSGSVHFSRVDEAPPSTSPDGDTSYVFDGTAGDRDTYSLGALPSISVPVAAVQTNLYARKDNTSSAKTIAPAIRQAGTNYDGTTTAGLTTSYAYYSQIYNQDPTSTDWTVATINADEFGVKEVS